MFSWANTKLCFIAVIFSFLMLNSCSITLNAQTMLLENKGQQASFIQYYKKLPNGMLYYSINGYSTYLVNQTEYDSIWHHYHQYKTFKKQFKLHQHRFDVQFVNALKPQIHTNYESETYYNFYIGKDRKKWASEVREYQQLTYKNLYQNIDFEVLSSVNAMKHNFIVHPGANPNDIKLNYQYLNKAELINNNLLLHTNTGLITEKKLMAFQLNGKDTVFVPCEFQLKKIENQYQVSFRLGKYNINQTLIIDPILVFSTYSGSVGDNFGFTSTHDSRSNLFGGGIVDGGTGTYGGPFPVTAGAFQTIYGSGDGLAPANLACDIGINKFDSTGANLLYSTYLGGESDEYPHSLVADNDDNLLVMGTTYSKDFPMDTIGYDTTFNGSTDIFVFKLSKNGKQAMGSTFMGGANKDGLNTLSLRYNYADDFRGDIVVDKYNRIYVASTTVSSSFPVKNAFQTLKSTSQDGCVFSLSADLSNLRFSTFVGGNGDDASYSIRIYDTFLYVAGGTSSNNMLFGMNGFNNSFNGGRADGYILKITENGYLINSTYFGTRSYDQIHFIDIDVNGQIYAAGQTEGNITRTAGVYGVNNTSQFIVRFSPNLAVVNLQTTFGNRTNNPEISPSAFLVDKCDNIYFSGWGSNISDGTLHGLTTNGLQVTSNAIQKTTDNNDFYLFVLNKNAQNLLYATFFGDPETEDHVDGGTSRFDKRGVVYQSVCASCPAVAGVNNQSFPISANAKFKTNLSKRCSNATFKIDFQITYIVDAKFTAAPIKGCEDLKVTFNNRSQFGRKFFWDFGDGSPIDTSRSPIHVFKKKGFYKVILTSVDSFSCNVSEKDSVTIEVLESPVADFKYELVECKNNVKFTNQSSNYKNPEWNLGDSSGVKKEENPEHVYQKAGRYNVLLKVEHPSSGCIDTQSVSVPIFSDPSESLIIPNVFTPNGDGLNQCYNIDGIDPSCDEAYIRIFNRWGIQIYNGYLPTQCWNGKLYGTGEEMPTGVYYFLLDIKSKNSDRDIKNISGVIHLIRN